MGKQFLDKDGLQVAVNNVKEAKEIAAGAMALAQQAMESGGGGETPDAIVTNIDEDYETPELTQNTKLYFSPSEDRECDITAGAASVGIRLFLYHSGSGNFKETVTYATGQTLVLTRKRYAILESVPGGWLFVKESRIGQMEHGYIIPRGATELAGQLRDKDALWHYITEYYSSLIVTDTAWQAGAVGKFVDYDSTQYRLPDFRGLFERNAGTNSKRLMANNSAFAGGNPGNVDNDKMQGHYHGVSQGVDYIDAGVYLKGTTVHGVNQSTQTLGPISDSVNGTPRKGAETKPASISLIPFIYFED